MSRARVLHETRTRLRVAPFHADDLEGMRARIARLPGVASVRANRLARCLVIVHDGLPTTRAGVLRTLDARVGAHSAAAHADERRRALTLRPLAWAPAVLAAALPALPRDWQRGAAIAVIAGRVITQPRRLRTAPRAVALDAVSLAAIAIGGHPLVVSASVLLRTLSEALSARMVAQADSLAAGLLPIEAERYRVAGTGGPGAADTWKRLGLLRAGDRVRLSAGDVVPVDGSIVGGAAKVLPTARDAHAWQARPGDHIPAGNRLESGELLVRAEVDVHASRLHRMRAHLRHAMAGREPAGRRSTELERLLSLPLTAAALVLGFTGDTTRAASMLQADPQQGLDLAVPLAREASLYALLRQGMLGSGLETVERLAAARAIVIQDTGLLGTGRWTIASVDTEPQGDPMMVRQWLAQLADTPVEILDRASLPDEVVRGWVRNGAVLRLGLHELHLASDARLRHVWGLAPWRRRRRHDQHALRRRLSVVADCRVVAQVELVCPLRPQALARLDELASLGFTRIAIFTEDDGADGRGGFRPAIARAAATVENVADDPVARGDWITNAASDGRPVVIAHTMLRHLVPAGSLSLTPAESDAGAHGVLLGDPLETLVAARRIAMRIDRRLDLHQTGAVTVNAALMTASALRWIPPIVGPLVHHGFAFVLLLDSLRIESFGASVAVRPPTGSAQPGRSPPLLLLPAPNASQGTTSP